MRRVNDGSDYDKVPEAQVITDQVSESQIHKFMCYYWDG